MAQCFCALGVRVAPSSRVVWGPGVLTDATTLSLASPAFGNSQEKTELLSGCFQGFLLQLLGFTRSLQGHRAPRGPEPSPRAPPWQSWSLGLASLESASLFPKFCSAFPYWGRYEAHLGLPDGANKNTR